ncbi:MAG: VOC family protein [Actinomycetia bacterium]|nr:VOC family protein [Actinomycetes bacterium]MCP4958081.1 VOC family protein [Actinomycetes bacterium]
MAGKVVHFEIPIDDNDRATGFYEETFGWTLQRWGPVEYWLTEGGQGEGIEGALIKRSDESPSPVFYIDVDDIEITLATIEATGGRRITEPMPIPTVGWSAFFEDTEGNRVGLFQSDPTVPMPAGEMPG